MSYVCMYILQTIIILEISICSIAVDDVSMYEKAHYTKNHHDLHRIVRSTTHSHLRDFEITIPFIVDAFGNHVTHELRHHRSRRSTNITNDPTIHLHIPTSNHEFDLELQPNNDFLHSEFTVKSSSGNFDQNLESMEDCHYVGKMISQELKSTAVSLCDGLSGLLRTNDNDFIIEPVSKNIPHDFPHPQHPHLVYKKSDLRREDNFYCGNTKTHPMPVPRTEEVYIKYLSDGSLILRPASNNLRDTSQNRDKDSGINHHRFKRGASLITKNRKRKVVETLVVADNALIEKHKSDHVDVTTYILTVMNMVNVLFRDETLDTEINIVLVGLIFLDNDGELDLGHRASKSLQNFCHWQTKYNGTMSGMKPDHSILLTGIDICVDKDEPCDTLGLAEIGGMCTHADSCTINEDTGLGLAFTVAHETGHSLGMSHDGQGNHCNSRGGNIMSPIINALNGVFTWSSCSRKSLDRFLRLNQSKCLDNIPNTYSKSLFDFNVRRELPGQLYDAETQCKLQFGQNKTLCFSRYLSDKDYLCKALWCQKNDGSCETKYVPASEGTRCGHDMWCRRGKCVPHGSAGPKPVNGGWSKYGKWSECSRSCGIGIAVKRRQCDNPTPMYGGRLCDGDDMKYRVCNAMKCPPYSVSYRAQQCAVYNTKPYRRQIFNWIPYTKYWKYGTNRCELLCEAEGFGFFDRLSIKVKDGTSCDDDTADVCIDGKCEHVGCDYVLNSNATVDACGICKGDNATCKFVNGTFTEPAIESGYYFVVELPIGASNVRIWEEECCTHTYIAVRSVGDLLRYYLNGNWEIDMYGDTDFAGTKWSYERKFSKPEKLSSEGLINERIVVEAVLMSKNPGISYSYYISEIDNALPYRTIKKSKPTKPTTEYTWHESYTACSRTCAGGFRENVVTCLENGIALVNDSFCQKHSKPRHRRNKCNTDACPSRWKKMEWSSCSKSCGNGHVTRNVTCSSKAIAGEESKPDSHCSYFSKPKVKKRCFLTDCSAYWKMGRWSKCSKTCGRGSKTRYVYCRDDTGEVLSDKCDLKVRPKSKRGCRMIRCRRKFQWLITAWGKCSSSCGEGKQRRDVRCCRENRIGGYRPVKKKRCNRKPQPNVTLVKTCTISQCPTLTLPVVLPADSSVKRSDSLEHNETKWTVGNWRKCSVSCGGGKQARRVQCMLNNITSTRCADLTKPSPMQLCNTYRCPADIGNDELCVDNYNWCYLVPYHKTCGHKYFGSLCCKSCAEVDKGKT